MGAGHGNEHIFMIFLVNAIALTFLLKYQWLCFTEPTLRFLLESDRWYEEMTTNKKSRREVHFSLNYRKM